MYLLKLKEKYEVIRIILKYEYIRYSHSEKSTINLANSQVNIHTHGENSVILPLNSYLDINFDVLHADNNKRYADNNQIRLDKKGPVALFSNYKLTTS